MTTGKDALSAILSAADRAVDSLLAAPAPMNPYAPAAQAVTTVTQQAGIQTVDIDLVNLAAYPTAQQPTLVSVTGDTVYCDPTSTGWIALWFDQANGPPFILRPGDCIKNTPFRQLYISGSPQQAFQGKGAGVLTVLPVDVFYVPYPQWFPIGGQDVSQPTQRHSIMRLRVGTGFDIEGLKQENLRSQVQVLTNWSATYGTTVTYQSNPISVGDGGHIKRATLACWPASIAGATAFVIGARLIGTPTGPYGGSAYIWQRRLQIQGPPGVEANESAYQYGVGVAVEEDFSVPPSVGYVAGLIDFFVPPSAAVTIGAELIIDL